MSVGGKLEEKAEFKGENNTVERTVDLRADKRLRHFCLLLTLKEEFQKIVGAGSDGSGLERTVRVLKMKVCNSCLLYTSDAADERK